MHASADIGQDEQGFSIGECTCGWKSAPVPSDEDAIDALMDHAANMARMEGLTLYRGVRCGECGRPYREVHNYTTDRPSFVADCVHPTTSAEIAR